MSDFSNYLLVPQYSDIDSRSEVDISTTLGPYTLQVPIVSANMDTVTDVATADLMRAAGGLGILHRYAPATPGHIHSVGLDRKQAEYLSGVSKSVCVDVAHGDQRQVHQFLLDIRRMFGFIIAGNVGTAQGAIRLADAGADVVKVGIGPGLVCTTRSVTGHGVNQVRACQDVATTKVPFIADGGFESSGDMVKALALGASACMTGRLLASGHYRGMASADSQVENRGHVSNGAPEGRTTTLPVVSVTERMRELAGGIRSGCSYSGARTLADLRRLAVWAPVQ